MAFSSLERAISRPQRFFGVGTGHFETGVDEETLVSRPVISLEVNFIAAISKSNPTCSHSLSPSSSGNEI
jgi:hypothetical protein